MGGCGGRVEPSPSGERLCIHDRHASRSPHRDPGVVRGIRCAPAGARGGLRPHRPGRRGSRRRRIGERPCRQHRDRPPERRLHHRLPRRAPLRERPGGRRPEPIAGSLALRRFGIPHLRRVAARRRGAAAHHAKRRPLPVLRGRPGRGGERHVELHPPRPERRRLQAARADRGRGGVRLGGGHPRGGRHHLRPRRPAGPARSGERGLLLGLLGARRLRRRRGEPLCHPLRRLRHPVRSLRRLRGGRRGLPGADGNPRHGALAHAGYRCGRRRHVRPRDLRQRLHRTLALPTSHAGRGEGRDARRGLDGRRRLAARDRRGLRPGYDRARGRTRPPRRAGARLAPPRGHLPAAPRRSPQLRAPRGDWGASRSVSRRGPCGGGGDGAHLLRGELPRHGPSHRRGRDEARRVECHPRADQGNGDRRLAGIPRPSLPPPPGGHPRRRDDRRRDVLRGGRIRPENPGPLPRGVGAKPAARPGGGRDPAASPAHGR
jgi:hypothetical protein